jgi:hypothetical protein
MKSPAFLRLEFGERLGSTLPSPGQRLGDRPVRARWAWEQVAPLEAAALQDPKQRRPDFRADRYDRFASHFVGGRRPADGAMRSSWRRLQSQVLRAERANRGNAPARPRREFEDLREVGALSPPGTIPPHFHGHLVGHRAHGFVPVGGGHGAPRVLFADGLEATERVLTHQQAIVLGYLPQFLSSFMASLDFLNVG